MGIANLTPDSFSDGGQYDQLEGLCQKLDEFRAQNVSIWDFGAQSTAPGRVQIGPEEESKRLAKSLWNKDIIERLKIAQKKGVEFSLDTYWPEVFRFFQEQFRKHVGEGVLIWNDVSGVVDEKTTAILQSDLKVKYILCHNPAQSRMSTGNHVSFEANFEKLYSREYLLEWFNQKLSALSSFRERLIVDPCFGFGKTAKINWAIWNDLTFFIEKLKLPLIVGISRKRFLKQFLAQKKDCSQDEITLQELDQFQSQLFDELLTSLKKSRLQSDIIFRIHTSEAKRLFTQN